MTTQISNFFIKESPKLRFCQGDILQNVGVFSFNDEGAAIEITLLNCVVINQECDLEHDYNARASTNGNQDKYLPNILLLPAYLSEQFRAGTHRGNIVCHNWSSNQWKSIENNNNPRFHFISENNALQIPNLVIDFKHCFSIERNYLQKKIPSVYLASLAEIFRENVSQRYCSFLGRIGLPV